MLRYALLLIASTELLVNQLPVSAASTEDAPLTAEQYVSLVSNLCSHYKCGCVFLLLGGNTTLSLAEKTVKVTRLLSDEGLFKTQTLTVDFEEDLLMDDTTRWGANRPLFVVMSTPEDARKTILRAKISCHPRWLTFLDATSHIPDFLDGVDVPFNCEFLIARRTNTSLALTEVYRVRPNLPLHEESFGFMSPGEPLVYPTRSLYNRRSSLHGAVLRAATVESPPIVKHEGPPENKTELVKGFFGNVWHVLEARMNFTTEFFVPEDGGYGSQTSNGSWNGMIAMILRGEVDVSINDFFMTVNRMKAIDYMRPIIVTSGRVFIRKSSGLTLAWDNFLKPFSARLWMTISLAVVVLSSFIAICSHLAWSAGAVGDRGRVKFDEALLNVIGLICQQGQEETPRAVSTQLVILTACMAAVILLAAYSAALVSYLTVDNGEMPFTSYQGLLDDPSYRLGVQAKSGKLNLLETTNDPVLHRVYTQLIAPTLASLPNTVREGLMDICTQHKYAFMTALDVANGLSSELSCDVTPLPHAAIPDTSGMVLPKKSPFKGIFNHNMQYLRHSGVLARLRANTWAPKMPSADTSLDVVSLEAVTPIFTIIAAGIALSGVFLLLELTTRHYVSSCVALGLLCRARIQVIRTAFTYFIIVTSSIILIFLTSLYYF